MKLSRLMCRPSVALAISFFIAACGGTATTQDDGDSGDDDDGSSGDGDASGDGDGDAPGDGDASGDGDTMICTDLYAYGITAVVVGGGLEAAPGPEPGGGEDRILPPSTGGGSSNEAPLPPLSCAATVTAVDGDYVETLSCFSTGLDCQCYGAGERAGTYVVTAQMGALSEQKTAVVTADACHVQGVTLRFFDAPR